jgi:hypothetical protein
VDRRKTGGRWAANLARVGVDLALVPGALVADDHELLHVGAQHLQRRHAHLLVDLDEEHLDVAEQLLGDALARAVDGQLELRAREHHGGGEHADGHGLAEAARGGHQDLLHEVVPPVVLEDGLVVAGEGARRVGLPEDARARLEEELVELPLVERAGPLAGVVDGVERGAALVHAGEAVADLGDPAAAAQEVALERAEVGVAGVGQHLLAREVLARLKQVVQGLEGQHAVRRRQPRF